MENENDNDNDNDNENKPLVGEGELLVHEDIEKEGLA